MEDFQLKKNIILIWKNVEEKKHFNFRGFEGTPLLRAIGFCWLESSDICRYAPWIIEAKIIPEVLAFVRNLTLYLIEHA